MKPDLNLTLEKIFMYMKDNPNLSKATISINLGILYVDFPKISSLFLYKDQILTPTELVKLSLAQAKSIVSPYLDWDTIINYDELQAKYRGTHTLREIKTLLGKGSKTVVAHHVFVPPSTLDVSILRQFNIKANDLKELSEEQFLKYFADRVNELLRVPEKVNKMRFRAKNNWIDEINCISVINNNNNVAINNVPNKITLKDIHKYIDFLTLLGLDIVNFLCIYFNFTGIEELNRHINQRRYFNTSTNVLEIVSLDMLINNNYKSLTFTRNIYQYDEPIDVSITDINEYPFGVVLASCQLTYRDNSSYEDTIRAIENYLGLERGMLEFHIGNLGLTFESFQTLDLNRIQYLLNLTFAEIKRIAELLGLFPVSEGGFTMQQSWGNCDSTPRMLQLLHDDPTSNFLPEREVVISNNDGRKRKEIEAIELRDDENKQHKSNNVDNFINSICIDDGDSGLPRPKL